MAFSVNHNLVTLSKNQLKSGRYSGTTGRVHEERRVQSKSAILVAVTDVTEDDTEDSVNAGHQAAQNQDIKIDVFFEKKNREIKIQNKKHLTNDDNNG